MSKIEVAEFFATVQEKHATDQAREHAYRPALEKLLKSINPSLTIINEPRRIECGSPDFVILRDEVPVGYVEAKDVGLDIRKMKGPNKEQQERYRDGIPNLIYTNGLDWDFYRHDGEGNSQRIASVTIGDYLMGLQANKTQFDVLETLLYEFVSQDTQAQTITSSTRLAKIMAGKAKLIRDALGKALVKDEDNKSDLAGQYIGFRDTLLHDIKKADFADIYAETIVYGMFAARYHDPTPSDFSRQEALELLPKSNPFLRKLFTFIAAHDLDEGIRWIIDDLAMIFQATRVDNIMARWSDANDKRDPFLHFYETFLGEYNPKKRQARGVWYTPEAVVNFIVRAVDDVLKTEFNEPMGLASNEKISVKVKVGTKEIGRKGNKRREEVYEMQEHHRVQVLDPATGTGTFLAEVINQIEPRIKAIDEGGWSDYVENNLKPRLHGFELLMASYSMCHLKLDMMLTETGYVPPEKPERLSVWLTNSLEEPKEDDNSLPLFGLARAISDEAKGANNVKADKPIMCIIGNPPYNNKSTNSNPWINKLFNEYKKGLNEKKSNVNDDYMKFIRVAEDLISKTKYGVVSMISNSSFLDGTTARKMREHLLGTFDKIWILNLHGGTRSGSKNEKDDNVFDITVENCLWIMAKFENTDKKSLLYSSLKGSRAEKYSFLETKSLNEIEWQPLEPVAPYHFFFDFDDTKIPKNIATFSIDDLFLSLSSGIQTKNDPVTVSMDRQSRDKTVHDFETMELEKLEEKYPSKAVWKSQKAAEDIRTGKYTLRTIMYKPFDKRFTVLTQKSSGFLGRPRYDVMKHIGENDLSLVVNKKHVGDYFSHAFVCDTLAIHGLNYLGNRGQDYVCPLYLYPDVNEFDQNRHVNMEPKIRVAIEKAATDKTHGIPSEVDIFDYIYGVLHCPAYRETYAEFLKIDFPRVPYPSSPESFWDISAKGRELRTLHLMDGVDAGTAYPFKGEAPEEGSGVVGKIGKKSFEARNDGTGNVMINDSQYFEGVPLIAWEFYIGGYQPAQKWLKDRKGLDYNNGDGLSFDDRMHYRKIIHILMETDRIMKTIEMDI